MVMKLISTDNEVTLVNGDEIISHRQWSNISKWWLIISTDNEVTLV